MTTIRQNIAAFAMLSVLDLAPKREAKAQADQKLSQLPIYAIATIPKSTAEYDGKLDIKLPHVPVFSPSVKAVGSVQRYEESKAKCDRIFWTDLDTGITIGRTDLLWHTGAASLTNFPLPKYDDIKMKKVGVEAEFGEIATILEVQDAPMMKNHLIKGRFLVTDDGVVLRFRGAEKTLEGEYTEMKITMTDFHRRRQDPEQMTPPALSPAKKQKSPQPGPG